MPSKSITIFLSFMIMLSVTAIGGCGAALNALENVDSLVNADVLVLVINNTEGTVRPDIQFDENADTLGTIVTGFVGGNTLNIPDMDAGQFVQFQFPCDELGLIFSDQSELRTIFGNIDADRSSTLTQDDDFQCGDEIRFEFFGDRNSFNVLITVNGRVVD